MICLARQRADFPVVNPRAEMPVEQSNGFGKPVENIRFFLGGGRPASSAVYPSFRGGGTGR